MTGAGAVLNVAIRKHTAQPDQLSRLQQWMIAVYQRAGYAKAKVAIANKHARQIWAILSKGEAYNSEAWRAWQAAHGEVQAADYPQDDLPTGALAAASV